MTNGQDKENRQRVIDILYGILMLIAGLFFCWLCGQMFGAL